jgi:hypothetical protein
VNLSPLNFIRRIPPDDPDMPVTTVRTWVLGIVWAIIIPVCHHRHFGRANTDLLFLFSRVSTNSCVSLSQFSSYLTRVAPQFFFRYPGVTITAIVAQLLSFPCGRAAAAYIPNWRILGVSLNPGPFTVKEHVLITVIVPVNPRLRLR